MPNDGRPPAVPENIYGALDGIAQIKHGLNGSSHAQTRRTPFFGANIVLQKLRSV